MVPAVYRRYQGKQQCPRRRTGTACGYSVTVRTWRIFEVFAHVFAFPLTFSGVSFFIRKTSSIVVKRGSSCKLLS
jgi:hypothetical protein